MVDEYCEKTLGKEDVFSICFNANKSTYTVEDLEQLYGKVEFKNTRNVSTLVVFVTDEKASKKLGLHLTKRRILKIIKMMMVDIIFMKQLMDYWN